MFKKEALLEIVWLVLPVSRPPCQCLPSPDAWKRCAIDSLMPEKTQLGVRFNCRAFRTQRQQTKSAQAVYVHQRPGLHVAISCQVFRALKTPQGPVPEGFQQPCVQNSSTRFPEDPKRLEAESLRSAHKITKRAGDAINDRIALASIIRRVDLSRDVTTSEFQPEAIFSVTIDLQLHRRGEMHTVGNQPRALRGGQQTKLKSGFSQVGDILALVVFSGYNAPPRASGSRWTGLPGSPRYCS